VKHVATIPFLQRRHLQHPPLCHLQGKANGYRQGMALLNEMRAKDCEPYMVTYNVLINAIHNEGDVDEAV
jgi:hypothetical protein